MSGRTQGEMNDRSPAANAARNVGFSLTDQRPSVLGDSCTGVSGMMPRVGITAFKPSHFCVLTSWNMKSHFQRSDGFDACSQCFPDTGREKLIVPRLRSEEHTSELQSPM